MDVAPLPIDDIRRDVRRVAALMRTSAPEFSFLKAKRRRLRGKNGHINRNIRSDIYDFRPAHRSRYFLKDGGHETSGKFGRTDPADSDGWQDVEDEEEPYRSDNVGLLPAIEKKPPALKHYNTLDSEEFTSYLKKKNQGQLPSIEGSVAGSDIDSLYISDMVRKRKSISVEGSNPGSPNKLPPIAGNKKGADSSKKAVRIPAENGGPRSKKHNQEEAYLSANSRLPRMSELQPSMKYKHGVIPKGKKKKVLISKSTVQEDGSTLYTLQDGTVIDSRILQGLEGENTTMSEFLARQAQSGSMGEGGVCAQCFRKDGTHEDWCPNLEEQNVFQSGRLPSEHHHGKGQGRMGPDDHSSYDSGNGTWVSDRTIASDRNNPESYLEHLDKNKHLNGDFQDGKLVPLSNSRNKSGKSGTMSNLSVLPIVELDDDNDNSKNEHGYISKSDGRVTFPNGVREAYIKALAIAQSKQITEPWHLNNRVSRSFVFSYYENVPLPWNSTPSYPKLETKPIKKGQEMKHIFGNIKMDDYYPGGKKNPITSKKLADDLKRSSELRKKKRKKRKGKKSPYPRSETSVSNHSHAQKQHSTAQTETAL